MGRTDSSFDSDMDLDAMEEDMQEIVFTRARRGPIVMQNPQNLKRCREQWAHFLIGFLLDDRSLSPRRVQTSLRIAWTLRDSFHVVGKEGKFYVFHFQSMEDKNMLWLMVLGQCKEHWYILQNGGQKSVYPMCMWNLYQFGYKSGGYR